MNLQAVWQIVGVVMEKRELTSKKNETWRGYVCKVASFGHTFELQLSPEQYQKIVREETIAFTGHFEDNKGYLRLITDSFKTAVEGSTGSRRGVA